MEQLGSGQRHEKIRTYNFPQDRVTDHRVGVSVAGIRQFMEGESGMDTMLDQLQAQEEARNITRLIDSYN